MTNPVAQMLIINEERIPLKETQTGIAVGSSFKMPEDFAECFEKNDEFMTFFKHVLSNGIADFLSVVTDLYTIPLKKEVVVNAAPSICELMIEFLKKAATEPEVSFTKENIFHVGFFFEEGVDKIGMTYALTDSQSGEQVLVACIEGEVTITKKLPGSDDPLALPLNPTVH